MDPIKHFEELWEEAESLAEKDSAPLYSVIDEIILRLEFLKNKPNEVIIESYGDILFLMCKLSKQLNINAYAALHNTTEDAREDLLDP